MRSPLGENVIFVARSLHIQVDEFDVKISVNPNIAGLQIPMNDAALVHVIECVKDLINYVANIVTFEALRSDYIIQIVLHDVRHKIKLVILEK